MNTTLPAPPEPRVVTEAHLDTSAQASTTIDHSTLPTPHPQPISFLRALAASVAAIASFHVAWLVPNCAPVIVLFLFFILQLTRVDSQRKAFHLTLATGFGCYAPHLGFFYTIFGPAAVLLWGILAAWLALFVCLARWFQRAFPPRLVILSLPVLWTALEYFRSELYYLRFSWLSTGLAFSETPAMYTLTHLGVYGVGFLTATLAAGVCLLRGRRQIVALAAGLAFLALLCHPPIASVREAQRPPANRLSAVGLQLETPTEDDLVQALNDLARTHRDAPLVVLSEYTLQRPPSRELLDWCRTHQRTLVVGGKDPVTDHPADDRFFNTAFVIGPDGNIVFRQVKSVPIQFFADGERATNQSVWPSPWGALGFAICYDLSYRRVMDPLVRLGATALIIPTIDESSWGAYQHQLHARIARVRAAEYGLPIFRVAGSGISQCVDAHGRELASAPFPGPGAILTGSLELRGRGRLPIDTWLAPAACVTALGFLTAALVCTRRTTTHRLDSRVLPC